LSIQSLDPLANIEFHNYVRAMSLERPCPICKKPASLAKENLFRPFCSDRCRLIDLGEWASGSYAVPDKSVSTDFDAEKEMSSSQDPDTDPEDRH
jgi:endogenous inhibitor of DNA gyrase (YacG/DUF329 family)